MKQFIFICGLFLLCLGFSPAAGAVVVKGVVYEDANGNKIKDRAEKGIPGVQVSDGEGIILSSENGEYSFTLDIDKENRFVFISQPAGYKPTTPFYFRIDPENRKEEYAVDFGLKEDPSSRNPDFKFLVVSDSQFVQQSEADLLREEFKQISETSGRPAFFFSVGDLTMSGTDEEFKMYLGAIEPFTIPVYHIFGGHDGNYGRMVPGTITPIKGGRGKIEHFEKWLGPAWYSWNYGNCHFITYVSETGFLSESQKKRQFIWIDKDISLQPEGINIIFATHDPSRPGGKLDEWSKKHKLPAIFYGHWHQRVIANYKDIPLILTAPIRGLDWGAFTRTYRVCSFKDGKLKTEMRVTGQYKRLVIVSPPPSGVIGRGNVPIHILAYDTPTWIKKVEVRIEGEGIKTNLPLKNYGQWTWQDTLDTDKIKPGNYKIEVAASNDKGETWSKEASFRLAGTNHPAPKPGGDWLFLLRNDKDMRNAEAELAPPLSLSWVVPTGGMNMPYTSPIFYRGKVYTGIQNDEVNGKVYCPGAGVACYDGKTGKEIWKTELNSSVRYG
ncbi:MAG: metallophosphoesterase N-terminal domain-containing protein, partial [Kiritimatiellia bacterium]|nr:metallophosphoesterase N-terminal domain-containing protein [Kiritimatiellia bacterium]